MGDGVNIAARLEGICEPGAICLSEDAYRQVKGRLDLAVSDLGQKELKNIADPVRVYSLEVGKPAQAKPATEPKSLEKPLEPKRRSARAPLALGIAALLVLIAAGAWHLLAGNRAAPIASNAPRRSRASIHRGAALRKSLRRSRPGLFRRRHHRESDDRAFAHPRQLRHRAQHRLHLQGQETSTPRRSARSLAFATCSKARCSATRTGCASTRSSSTPRSGAHLWADRFEEDVADLFKLQDEVVARLADSLDWALTEAEAEKGARSKNPDVIDLTMRGWTCRAGTQIRNPRKKCATASMRRGPCSTARSKLTPTTLMLWLEAPIPTFLIISIEWGDPGTDYEAKVLGQANRAIALDADNLRAYFAKADYLGLSRRFQRSPRRHRRRTRHQSEFRPALCGARPRRKFPRPLRAGEGRCGAGYAAEPARPHLSAFFTSSWATRRSASAMSTRRSTNIARRSTRAFARFSFTRTSRPPTRMRARWTRRRPTLAEARRLNPAITVKWMKEHTPNLPGGVRRPPQSGTAGRMTETRKLAAILRAFSGLTELRGFRLGCGDDSLRGSNRRWGVSWAWLIPRTSGSGDGCGGRGAQRLFGRAAVSGQRVVHLQGARPAACDRRCDGPQVGRRPKAEARGL